MTANELRRQYRARLEDVDRNYRRDVMDTAQRLRLLTEQLNVVIWGLGELIQQTPDEPTSGRGGGGLEASMMHKLLMEAVEGMAALDKPVDESKLSPLKIFIERARADHEKYLAEYSRKHNTREPQASPATSPGTSPGSS